MRAVIDNRRGAPAVTSSSSCSRIVSVSSPADASRSVEAALHPALDANLRRNVSMLASASISSTRAAPL